MANSKNGGGESLLPELISKRIADASGSSDLDAAFLQLGDLLPRFGELAPLQNRVGGHCPPTNAAMTLALVADAMNRTGHSEQVSPMLRSVGDSGARAAVRPSSPSSLALTLL